MVKVSAKKKTTVKNQKIQEGERLAGKYSSASLPDQYFEQLSDRVRKNNEKKSVETSEKENLTRTSGKVKQSTSAVKSSNTPSYSMPSSKSSNTSKNAKKTTIAAQRIREGERLAGKYSSAPLPDQYFEQLSDRVKKREAGRKLAQEYAVTKTKQPAETKASSRLTYSGKQGNISYVQAQKDPGYKDYVRKGSQSAQGYSDGFIGNLKMAAKVRGFGSPDGRAEFLNADEKDMYNYLLGKYGKETAREFKQSLGDVTAARLRDDETKNVRDASKRNIAAGIAYNSVGALESPKGYIYAATKMGIDKAKEIKALMNAESTDEYKNILEEYKRRNTPVDTNNEAFSSNAIMNASNQGIKDAIGGTPVRDFAIDTGLSITQAMSRLPLGPLNVAVAGGSAATDAYVDAAERGATGTQALAQGAAQGTAEGAGEAFSLGKLKALKEVPGKGARAVLTNLVKQGISEGSEEAATEIMNSISDKIIMGDKSNYDTSVRYYKSLGLSDEEAKQKAYADIAGNVGLAALGGATSGVIMGGGAQALGNILQRNAAQEYARQKAVPQESLLQEEQTTASQTIPDVLPEENTARQQVKEQQAAALENTAQRMIEGVTDPVENTPLIAGNVSDGDAQERGTERTIQANEKGGEDRTEFSTIQNQPENAAREGITSPTIAENTESIQNRENIGPQYVREPEQKEDLSAYAREYAVSPQEAERQSYIESHREDLNDIFSDLGEKGKTAAVEQYDPDIPISQYRRAFNVFYDAGRYANDITPAEKSAVSVFLSGTQQVEAYKAGARDRLLELEAKRQVKKGETREGGFEDRSSNATDAQRKLSESLGKRTGLKFVLEDSLESGAVGEYEGKTGTIRISTNSENFLRTNSHELTHFIKENAPESYASYRDAVISAYLTSENQTFEKMVESYERAYEKHGQKLSRDEIMEEITADATGKFWNDEEFVRKIANKDKTVAQKIVDFLSDMLDAIKSLIKNEHTGRAAEMLAEQQELFEDARNRWMDALDQASENYKMGETSTESAVRFQLAKPDQVTDKHIEENYDYVRKMDSVASIRGDEFKGDPKEMRSKIIELYNSYGNVVHNDVVGDVALSMRSVRNDLAHGYGDKKAAAFATVKDVIENGKVLRYSKDWKGRGYDSVSIGAKINITDGENAGQYYEVCVIKVDRTNRMYLHEVDIEKADSVPFNYAQAEPAKKHSGYNYLPISSIFDRLRNVKNENVKYQLGDNELEETDNKELVARNDLTEEKLVESLDMNSPISLKTKPGKGGEDMGDISIVFKKDAVASGEIQKGNFKDGVAAVILPTDASDNLKARLNQEGINTILYDPNLPDARKKAISELKDVRFQIDDSDMDIDYDEVVRENGELRKINEELKNQLVLTKDYTPRKEDIRKYAKSLLREYNSTYSQEKLESNLSRFYEYIQKAERMDAQELANVATQIGRAILEKSQQTDQEQVKVYKNILQDIKGTPIYVPEEVRNNLDSEGGYNSFRKKYMGQITFRNAGVSVDAAYNELAGLHPDLFPTDIINPTDQLLRIADVLEESRPKVENPYGADIDEMSVFLGEDILDNRANIRNIPPTLADKLFEKADKREEEYIAKRKEYEQKLREYRGNVREREQGRRDKKQIIRDVTKMQKWLLSPTDRDHVPESMRTAVAKFLSCVDYSSSRLNADGNETQRTREWNEAKKVYDTILKNNGVLKGETSDIYVEVDPDLVTKLDELQSMAEGKKIEDFTPRELRTLRETVSAMKHSIEDANKMYTNKRYEKASEAAESTLREWQGRKNKKTIKALSAADKFLQVHMLDSFTAFDRLGKAATTVYQGLRDGFDTKMRDTRLAQEYMEKLKKKLEIGGKEIQEWTGNKAKRQTFQVSGGEISLTPAQVMSLYELNKRPQAREHLYNQLRGIRTQGVEREVTVKGKKLFKVVEANVPVAVTPSDVKAITDTLTPKQKALADGVVSFFTDQTAAWGNEVSMTLYGYKKFNAPNYFPIVVDKNEIAKTNADVSRDIQTLKNLGITKNTTKHAKNGLIIEDIFDVYTRQADQMGSYHSFVVPLSDFQKYYNFNDVEKGNLREQMERVYGKEMGAWVDAFLKDLNGVGSGERELTSNLLRNAKSAAVGWNLRTAIQQPTAYFRAAAEIDPKYLAQGLKLMVSDAEWDQVKDYSPIAWWKDQGFFDINTGRSMKSMLIGADTTREKMINKSMDLAGKGDELAWKRLWMATKAETAALHPELTVGSEEFLQKSGARFSEIIDKTQVVDSVFHRSWAMREQWTKFYTAFMSEPIKSYNMLYRAAMDIADSKEINGKAGKAEKTKFARVAASYAVTGVITALAASVMDAVRDDDDDKGIKEKYLSALGANIADNLNVVNLIPIAKDVVSMFGGNSAARMDMQGLQYLVYACNEMKKFVEGDSKNTTTGIMYKWISPLARMTGIPIANLLRDTGSVVDTALDIAGANAGDYWKTKRIYDISSADNVTMYAKKALKAYREGKKELGDRILSDLIEAGQSDKTVNSGVKRGLKNDPVIQEAAEAMMNWDLETYEEKVEEVADRGIDKELIVKAVDMVINKKKKDAGEEEESTEKDASEPEEKEEKKETPLYEASDANDALNAGEYDKANKILDKVVESKMAEGKKKKEAISSVKSSFSSKYRKRYIAAGADERAKIEIELERLRVGGSRIFSSEDFARWRKNAKKK
ncbi:MAG: hypothetical protein UEL03_01835 [Clostridium sp.]|uniref:hypothetical protein n=1 Tax=Clostridium sp. TaxID=1506 RepID=UPI002E77B925|nr:hypothetical protein [Clostridium sp.]MEE0130119.1 hypothetical protein [Clostridium sp.]